MVFVWYKAVGISLASIKLIWRKSEQEEQSCKPSQKALLDFLERVTCKGYVEYFLMP